MPRTIVISAVVALFAFLHLASSSSAATLGSKDSTSSLLLNLPTSQSLNLTHIISSGHGYRIPRSHMTVIIESQSGRSDMRDTLILLVESIFSAATKIHAGGEEADDPVEVFTHIYGRVQLQIVGFEDLLTPFKTAQIFEGMAAVGARIGYWYCTLSVLEDGKGKIAKIDIR